MKKYLKFSSDSTEGQKLSSSFANRKNGKYFLKLKDKISYFVEKIIVQTDRGLNKVNKFIEIDISIEKLILI